MTPHIVIDGEVVSEKAAEHPAFRNVARSYAKLFDMQHGQRYQEALTYMSPTTGDLGERVLPGSENRRGPEAPAAGDFHLGGSVERFPGADRRLHELRAHRTGHGREMVLPG